MLTGFRSRKNHSGLAPYAAPGRSLFGDAMKTWIQRLGQTLLVAGLLLLSYSTAIWVYADGFQAYQKWIFDSVRAQPSKPLTQQSVTPHAVIGRIEIPRLNLTAMIVEGVEEGDLLRGAGHVPGTALPGEPGNLAIGGHRDTFFRPLRNIRNNDIIVVTTLHDTYQYAVTSTEITGPDDTKVLDPTPDPMLTLISCYPFSYVGPAPERFIVRARLIGIPTG